MIDLRMRSRLALLLLAPALCGLLSTPTWGKEDPPRVPGTVTLSDGTVLKGKIRATAGKPLRVYEKNSGRIREILIEKVHRVATHVAYEEEYRDWRWVEDGSREKVYTGETYPKREYEVEVTLRNGQVLRGHAVAVLYVYLEGKTKPKKVYLKKKEQGQKGKTLADLVYVETIEFEGPPPPADGGAAGISLTVTPPGKVVAAHALARERDRPVQGSLVKSRVSFPSVLPGTYDLAVVTDENIYLSLAVGSDGGKPISGEFLDLIKKRVAEIPDFFEDREVLAAVREGDKVRALVFKQRWGPTSMGGKRLFRRWEIWSMHKGGDRWLVDNRAYIWREHDDMLPPPRGFALTNALSGVKVSTGIAKATFAIPGKDER